MVAESVCCSTQAVSRCRVVSSFAGWHVCAVVDYAVNKAVQVFHIVFISSGRGVTAPYPAVIGKEQVGAICSKRYGAHRYSVGLSEPLQTTGINRMPRAAYCAVNCCMRFTVAASPCGGASSTKKASRAVASARQWSALRPSSSAASTASGVSPRLRAIVFNKGFCLTKIRREI